MPPRRLQFATPNTTPKRRKTKSGRSAKTPINNVGKLKLGEQVGSSNTKNVTIKVNSQMLGWNLYSEELTKITRGTELSQRQRDVINLRGIDIDASFRTITQSTGAGLLSDIYYLNVAILAPKTRVDPANFTSNFFRAMDGTDERERDFDPTLGSMDLHTLPVNTDIWYVLRHQRHAMPTFQSSIPGWNKRIKMYVPIDRQVSYTVRSANDSCNDPIYIVYWVCRSYQNSQVDALVAFTDVQFRATTFFRETPN